MRGLGGQASDTTYVGGEALVERLTSSAALSSAVTTLTEVIPLAFFALAMNVIESEPSLTMDSAVA